MGEFISMVLLYKRWTGLASAAARTTGNSAEKNSLALLGIRLKYERGIGESKTSTEERYDNKIIVKSFEYFYVDEIYFTLLVL